jgi:thiamine phosphate synthase YjbQ (UPF0047 family)
MIKRVLTLVNAMHITASVFINDDESGLHHDYELFKLRTGRGSKNWRLTRRSTSIGTTERVRTMPTPI